MAQLLRIRMQCKRYRRCGFDPWVRKIPWRRAWQPTPVFLPGEFHRQRSLACYTVHRLAKSLSWLSDWAHIHTNIILWAPVLPSSSLHCRHSPAFHVLSSHTGLLSFPRTSQAKARPLAFAPVGPPSKNSPLTDFCMADLLYLVGFNWNFTSQGSSLPILRKTAFSHLPLSFIALIIIRNYLLICWLVISGLIPVLAKLHTSRNFASFT